MRQIVFSVSKYYYYQKLFSNNFSKLWWHHQEWCGYTVQKLQLCSFHSNNQKMLMLATWDETDTTMSFLYVLIYGDLKHFRFIAKQKWQNGILNWFCHVIKIVLYLLIMRIGLKAGQKSSTEQPRLSDIRQAGQL